MEGQILLYFLKIFNKVFFAFLIFIIIFSYYVLNKNTFKDFDVLTITKGENIENVIKKNLININVFDLLIFKTYFYVNYIIYKEPIHYGDFELSNERSFIDLINIITKPSNVLNKITVVEGWSISELNNEMSKHFQNYKSIEYNSILADTYYFNKTETFEKFFNRIKSFKIDYLEKNKDNKFFEKYSIKELIIIGSLLEKEGLDYLDKSKISSVILNRLDKNMRLEIDATVIFSLTNGKYNLNRKLTYKDLKIEHPYNTYKNFGLPPKPISYVGTKTIDIILENYKSNYLFYFFDSTLNKHIFSENYEIHKKRSNEYRNKK